MNKFEITKNFGFNDCGVIVSIDEYDEHGDVIADAYITLREDKRCPSSHGWKKALIEEIRNTDEFSRGVITAIRMSGEPYYTGSEDPYWM